MCVVQSFLEAVGGRGMGALELVAMDMKARGMYVCRTLSFSGQLLTKYLISTPHLPHKYHTNTSGLITTTSQLFHI